MNLFIDYMLHLLIVDDNKADIRLVQEAFKKERILIDLKYVLDGLEALAYLRKEGKYKDSVRPDLILLDLNMPRMDGRELLEIVKSDEDLKVIPIIVMTISKAEEDILKSYKLHCNAYIIKPIEIRHFFDIVKSIEQFWITIVKLPTTININYDTLKPKETKEEFK